MRLCSSLLAKTVVPESPRYLLFRFAQINLDVGGPEEKVARMLAGLPADPALICRWARPWATGAWGQILMPT